MTGFEIVAVAFLASCFTVGAVCLARGTSAGLAAWGGYAG